MTAPDPHITISTAWHLTTDIGQLLIGTALHYSQENEIQWFSDLKGGASLTRVSFLADLEYKKLYNPDVNGEGLVETVIQQTRVFFQVLQI